MNLKYLLITALLVPITACSATDTTKLSQAETNTDKLANINTYGCKNLHKVTDIDDLLKQMYDNIDSHCLFEMNTDDLERVWGVKVFDYTKYPKIEAKDVFKFRRNEKGLVVAKARSTLFYQNKDGLTIEKPTQYFHITVAEKSQKELVAGSQRTGSYPKYLPNPIVIAPKREASQLIRDKKIKERKYQMYGQYFWLNSTKSLDKPFIHIEVELDTTLSDIAFYHDIESRITDINQEEMFDKLNLPPKQ